MATEGLMRMVESSREMKWPPSKDSATFGSPLRSMTAEESGFISKGHGFKRDRAELIPNRSGQCSTKYGRFLSAIENLLCQQNSSMKTSLTNLNNVVDSVENEENLSSDPARLAYYLSNMNLNARPPPPLIVRENHHLVRHSGGLGTKWRSISLDDSASGSLHLSQGSLSTLQEDPNDASSSRKSQDNLAEDSVAVMPVKDTASLASYNKSLVDLIQQDFPRTPSPVYNHSLSSSLGTTDELIDSDAHSLSPNASSLDKSKLPEPNSNSINDCPDTSASYTLALGIIPNDVPLPTSSPSAQQCQPDDGTGNLQKDESNIGHDGSRNNASINGDLGLDISSARASKVDTNNNKQQELSYGRYVPQHNLSTQQGVPYQLQGFQAQLVSQGMNYLQSGMQNLPYSYPKFSSIETQPSLHSPGVTPALYSTPTPYMTSGSPFYPNYQSSGVFPPQYSMGGYTLGSTFLPSYMPGYTSHGSFSMPFDASLGPRFSGQTVDVSRGERIPHEGDMQHHSRFYGQHGPMLQPPFVDPLYTQYYARSLEDSYGASIQYGYLSSRGQLSQQELNANAYTDGPNSTLQLMFPASPLGSPILPSSPMGRTNHFGRKYELRTPQGSVSGVYSGWQGLRNSILDDPRRHSLLEELKSSNPHKFELSDIAERIVDFSVDQHGSRFIQQKLEYSSAEDKFFEYGTPEQKKELADQLAGQMLPLSLQMYGCRVIQKALEVIELDQKIQLVHELDGHVMICVRDQNGNHVIQKCIECIPTEKIGFIISAFQGQVATLSTHPYGCRVIQRVLEHCSDDLQSQCIVDEILESAYDLAQDQYGNYVTQHVLERGKPNERSQIISKLVGKIVQLSQHKYASNVVEKGLEYGDTAERELLIEEIIGQMEENDSLLAMMKDQFANYVVQKVLETSNGRQREILLKLIRVHIDALKKYTYGKHIVVRFQQLSGEENNGFDEEEETGRTREELFPFEIRVGSRADAREWGFGSVYLATVKKSKLGCEGFPTVMAVKTFSKSSELATESSYLTLFRDCPFIIGSYGTNLTIGDDGYLKCNVFLEYADGGTIGDLIEKSGGSGLCESDVSKYTKAILKGLEYIHERGYVHCDLKPDNILLVRSDSGFVPKIGDFGLAKMAMQKLSRQGTSMYFSPETVTHKIQEQPSDIWAKMLKTFAKMPTEDPFKRSTVAELLTHSFVTKPDRVGEVEPVKEVASVSSPEQGDYGSFIPLGSWSSEEAVDFGPIPPVAVLNPRPVIPSTACQGASNFAVMGAA
ncbi:hypothetical protein DVH24_014718 [Malus domestica]|uniref:PUM-HD domain-containing protein n=1 Tax=Malus domestica TaxID=3750 RepID=A0A498KNJ0_MALDO|nr:hypothetical protein DVH24_014718 [Malus domestica]